jgi:hypothetical protein
MAEQKTKIRFEAQPLKVGADWHVVAVYPNGQREHITGFRSEEEALHWIGGQGSYAWLKGRGYAE